MRSQQALSALSQEHGNASVEFIGWTLLLVVPVVYLLVALAQVQVCLSTFASSTPIP